MPSRPGALRSSPTAEQQRRRPASEPTLAALGASLAVAVITLIGTLLPGSTAQAPWIIAPIGASAVLLFCVPASPMAQPWPVLAGSTASALAGLGTGTVVSNRTLAAGLAVGLAVAIMSATRSLHPPGGAIALSAVLGGPTVTSAGVLFPLAPVALDAAVLVGCAWLFHRLVSAHPYPHPTARPASTSAHLDATVAEPSDRLEPHTR